MQSQHKQRLIITGRRCSLPYQLARLSSCFPIGWDILSFLPPRLLVQCWMRYPSPSPVRTRLSSSPFSTDVWLTREHASKCDRCKFYQYKKNDIKSTFTELTNFLLFKKSWQSWRHQPSAHSGLVVNIMPMHSFILSGRFSAPLRES